jgi:DNA-directed RNA polymerase subunit RPC12/RpoP
MTRPLQSIRCPECGSKASKSLTSDIGMTKYSCPDCRWSGYHQEPADHELRYVARASTTVCVECGATFETEDLR